MKINVAVMIAVAIMAVESISLAQPQGPDTLWTYEFRGPQDDMGMDMIPTADGGFMFLIESEAMTVDSGEAVLVKLDSTGHEVWRQLYRDPEYRIIIVKAVAATHDGGFVIAGGGGLHRDQTVLFTDSVGNPQRFRYYQVPFADPALDIVATRDGGFALLMKCIGLLRLNANGDSLWSCAYWDNEFGYGGELMETEDGGFVLCGTRGYGRPDSTRGVQPWICRTDSLGTIVWERRLDTMGADWCNSLAPTYDGDYIIAGWADSTGYSTLHPLAARISASGDSVWAHVWNDVHAGLNRCRALPDGCFILYGLLMSDSPYFTRHYVMKIDGEGNRLWERTYGYVPSVDAGAMAVLSDGSLGIGGDQWNGATGYDAWAARTGLAVLSAPPPAVMPESYSFLTNYPNPFNGSTQIEFALPSTQRVSLRLYDVLGREVAILVDEIKTAGEHRVTFDAAGLASGVYWCRMEAGSIAQTRKMVLLR